MRWTIPVAQAMPHLRAFSPNGRRDELIEYHAETEQGRPSGRAAASGSATHARFLSTDHPGHSTLRRACQGKLPDAEPLFQLGDFSVVAFAPQAVRLVAVFGRAVTLPPEAQAVAVAETAGEAGTADGERGVGYSSGDGSAGLRAA